MKTRKRQETMEENCRRQAEEWRRFARTPEYAREIAQWKRERATADAKAGHVPGCSLTKCADGCKSPNRNAGFRRGW